MRREGVDAGKEAKVKNHSDGSEFWFGLIFLFGLFLSISAISVADTFSLKNSYRDVTTEEIRDLIANDQLPEALVNLVQEFTTENLESDNDNSQKALSPYIEKLNLYEKKSFLFGTKPRE